MTLKTSKRASNPQTKRDNENQEGGKMQVAVKRKGKLQVSMRILPKLANIPPMRQGNKRKKKEPTA